MAPDDPPDVQAEMLRALNQVEARFRLDCGLDVDVPRDPDEPDVGDPNRARFENSIGKTLLPAADALVASPQLLEWREKLSGSFPIGQLASWLSNLRLVRPQLRIDLLRRELDNLEAKTSRLSDVLAVLIESPPSERARAYLQRVSRCYLNGLEPETVIMCRAVLDAAFEDRISESLVWTHVPRNHAGQTAVLADRITAAQRSGIISPEMAASARAVKDAANQAVHGIPLATLPPLEAVRVTATVLGAIAA